MALAKWLDVRLKISKSRFKYMPIWLLENRIYKNAKGILFTKISLFAIKFRTNYTIMDIKYYINDYTVIDES